jgi:hypothetical protein
MDLYLETLLNLPLTTIESCQIQDNTAASYSRSIS